MWSLFFPELGCFFFFLFFLICVICLSPASWLLRLKQKFVHCILSSWLIWLMLRSYTCWCFCNTFIIFPEPDFVLSLQIQELVQTAWAHTQLDFSLMRYLSWVVKYKGNKSGWKINKKMLKLTKLITQISFL